MMADMYQRMQSMEGVMYAMRQDMSRLLSTGPTDTPTFISTSSPFSPALQAVPESEEEAFLIREIARREAIEEERRMDELEAILTAEIARMPLSVCPCHTPATEVSISRTCSSVPVCH